MQIQPTRIFIAAFWGAGLLLSLLGLFVAVSGCLSEEPSTPEPPRPAHYWEMASFSDSFYFHDTRTDLCYFASTIAGSTNFVLVPCTDRVMGVAIEGPE